MLPFAIKAGEGLRPLLILQALGGQDASDGLAPVGDLNGLSVADQAKALARAILEFWALLASRRIS